MWSFAIRRDHRCFSSQSLYFYIYCVMPAIASHLSRHIRYMYSVMLSCYVPLLSTVIAYFVLWRSLILHLCLHYLRAKFSVQSVFSIYLCFFLWHWRTCSAQAQSVRSSSVPMRSKISFFASGALIVVTVASLSVRPFRSLWSKPNTGFNFDVVVSS